MQKIYICDDNKIQLIKIKFKGKGCFFIIFLEVA